MSLGRYRKPRRAVNLLMLTIASIESPIMVLIFSPELGIMQAVELASDTVFEDEPNLGVSGLHPPIDPALGFVSNTVAVAW